VRPRRTPFLAALLAVLVLVPAATASESRPTQSEIESEVICPTCHTTLDQSSAPIARRMKAVIRARIAAGDTKSEIEGKLVDEFGPQVLAKPGTTGFDLLAWALPIGGVLVGAAVLAFAAWHWSRRRVPEADLPPPLDAESERRLDDELTRYEA
jgi:cytochrome c-type biogenesis protein CcmH